MRSKLDEQLEMLSRELIEMGSLCENAIANTAKALTEGSIEFARKAMDIDMEIDEKEKVIEALCLKLLLQQQPVAKDLRQISAALKMITDMERIGDQASDIAEIITLANIAPLNNKLHIGDMAKATIKMVTESVDAYVHRDLELARAVMEYDDVVDNLFDKIKKELIELISRDTRNGEFAIDLLMIAKYFERIGDHATNIAEWVEYSITGIHRVEKEI